MHHIQLHSSGLDLDHVKMFLCFGLFQQLLQQSKPKFLQYKIDLALQRMQQIDKQMQRKKTQINMIIKKDYFVKSRKNNIKQHYEFQRVLGKGAFGTVYMARANYFPHQTRAIKVITKQKVRNSQNLIDQVTILKLLDHPSIIKIYETYENDKHLCIVLEQVFIKRSYCQGGQLYERMAKNGTFSENQAKSIFLQMVKVVKYMHTNKICHRDLKLQNFLMYKKDSLDIKLIDFGLSKKWQHDLCSELIESGQNKLVGTIYYMAPEVIERNYDQKCDIWSLGVLLYIMVSGMPPFDAQNDKDVLERIRSLKYTTECAQMSKISSDLKDLISKILMPSSKRLSLDEIMQHRWMRKQQSCKPLQINFSRMREFMNFSRMKKVVMTYIASQLPQSRIHELGEIFKQIDQDMNGLLTTEQLKQALEQQQNSTISNKQLLEILSSTDTDQNGKINYNEFITACLEGSHYNDEKYLKRVFEYFDVNNDGVISYNEFKEILESADLQRDIDDEKIDEIIKDADANKDGDIDYNEFLNSMRSMDKWEAQAKWNGEV